MLPVSDSLRIFLTGQRNGRNSDLLNRVLKYGTDLELQINVSPKGGELVDGTISTYTDGINRWHSFRIPKDSYSDAHWQDYKLRFPLDKHVESIGSTGWLWAKKQSLWFAYDFDSIIGHAAGVGISDEELARVRDLVSKLDYVEVRRSTGGTGLHLYVLAPEGVKTANHHEHAAVSRSVLTKMSEEVGFNLCQHVDTCGGNTWIWAKRATDENQGFSLLKPATCVYPYPIAPVVAKPVVPQTSTPNDELFTRLTSGRVPLSAVHKRHIEQLPGAVWHDDQGCLHTHTCVLDQLYATGTIAGTYSTNSPGTNLGSANCFCYPRDNDEWRIVRFGKGVQEADTWTHGEYTTCFFNRRPINLMEHGTRQPKPNTRLFSSAQLADLLPTLTLPETDLGITATRHDRDVVLSTKHVKGKPVPTGWVSSGRTLCYTLANHIPESTRPESMIRAVRPVGDITGTRQLQVLTSRGWENTKDSDIRTMLIGQGFDDTQSSKILSDAIITNPCWGEYQPFGPDDLGDGVINTAGDCWKVKSHEGPTRLFDSVLTHIGKGLDSAVSANPWCQRNGIESGHDYLLCWYASAIQQPAQPLPGLALYSPEQNMSGKTTMSELPELLVYGHLIQKMKGNSLTSGFTGNSDTAVFVIIEELNLNAKAEMAIEMKRRITATMLESERKHQNARLANHFGKYIQTCNDASYIPFTPGDDRLVGWQVTPLKPEEIIPNMRQKLAEEAPAIRHRLETYVLPSESAGRAFLPILMTDLKRQALLDMSSNIPGWLLDLMMLAGPKTLDLSAAELAAKVQTHKVSYQRICRHLQLESTRESLQGQGYSLTVGTKTSNREHVKTFSIAKL